MKKRKKEILKVSIITPVIIGVIMYLVLAWYYKDTFSYGTWINGVYSTGKTIEDINQNLLENVQLNSFEILLPDGKSQTIPLEYINYQMDFMGSLEKCQKKQNPLAWAVNIFDIDGIIIHPNGNFSEDLLMQELENFSFYQNRLQENDYKISISKTESGYICVDTRMSILDYDKAISNIENSLKSGKSYVNLYDEACYYELPMTVEDLETLELWGKIEEVQEFSTVFQFGEEKEIIDASIVSDWIMINDKGLFVLDEQGNLVVDESKIEEYIHFLALKYNTSIYPRIYKTIDGREASLSKGNYGNLFDEEVESMYLKNAFNNKIEEIHTPTYIKKALYQGIDDIGPDYIEIDLTNQKMYLVLGNIIKIETDIVTGNVAKGMQTTDRICYIYSKMRNQILRGDGYASLVDYWMPIYGGIGIHDAKWRNSFGGDIYKRSGSHGCINTPRDVMEEIYEFAFVGMPVIMYY